MASRGHRLELAISILQSSTNQHIVSANYSLLCFMDYFVHLGTSTHCVARVGDKTL